jgi:hypothetical protein
VSLAASRRRRDLSLALLVLAAPMAAFAQEYQVGVAYTSLSVTHRWNGNPGATPPTLQPDSAGSAPSFIGNLQYPVVTVRDFTLTADLGLRWALGDDIGVLEWGAGVSRAIARGYVALHWTWHAPGDEALGEPWSVYTEGPRAIVRYGRFRADVTRMVKQLPRSYLTYSKHGLLLRYRIVGVELERWREASEGPSGSYRGDLNRLSVFLALGQWEDRRGK